MHSSLLTPIVRVKDAFHLRQRQRLIQRLRSIAAPCMVVSVAMIVLLGSKPLLAAQSRDEQLKECRVIYARIDHFTQLRRSGGSAQRMATWKTSLRRAEKSFREQGCHRFSSRYLRSN